MPFEQRTSTYFICIICKCEYELPGNAEYSRIYKCAREGCNHEETFLGLQPTTFSVSQEISEGIFKRMWRNNIVQGVIAGAILFLILGSITLVITNNLIGDLKEELQEIRNEISLIEGNR